MPDWFDREMDALDEQFHRGEISRDEYRAAERELAAAARDEEAREDIIAAGRGHLLRDW